MEDVVGGGSVAAVAAAEKVAIFVVAVGFALVELPKEWQSGERSVSPEKDQRDAL